MKSGRTIPSSDRGGDDETLCYFAYGSNMSHRRLAVRVPSATPVATARLAGHRLAFHKVGRDGSGKCDIIACEVSEVLGVLYRMAPRHKPALDACEDLGRGYAQTSVYAATADGRHIKAFTYVALLRDTSLRPFRWYLRHVLEGANEHRLPSDYREMLASIDAIEDPDPERSARELSLYASTKT